MKRLSDYKGEEAIELWADLLEPLSAIFTDKEIAELAKEEKLNYLSMATIVLKSHSTEAVAILERIDDTPVDGLNILTRLIGLLTEIGETEYAKSFFGFAGQDKKE